MLAEKTRSLAIEQQPHGAGSPANLMGKDSALPPAKKTRRRRVKSGPSETAPTLEDVKGSASTTPKGRKRKALKESSGGRGRWFTLIIAPS